MAGRGAVDRCGRRRDLGRLRAAPDRRWFGATHAPHHVPKEWADGYAGQFDDGWDAYREKVFARQKELGIAPADAELSRHDPGVPDWESLPPQARRLYSRMMEVFAGFLSHAVITDTTGDGHGPNAVIITGNDPGPGPAPKAVVVPGGDPGNGNGPKAIVIGDPGGDGPGPKSVIIPGGGPPPP